MWHDRRWIGDIAVTAGLVIAGVPLVGFADRPLKQLAEAFEVIKGQGPMAGVSWSVINGSEPVIEWPASRGIGQHRAAKQQAAPSAAWLDLHGGKSRAANREPDLWRREF